MNGLAVGERHGNSCAVTMRSQGQCSVWRIVCARMEWKGMVWLWWRNADAFHEHMKQILRSKALGFQNWGQHRVSAR